mmetsp:Transcript_116089/g.248309  ORF Transcript_116089/g.248309 Transcript_116089/m.248309 type:complete len:227 (-) Transcript_116089:2661-3341(-)
MRRMVLWSSASETSVAPALSRSAGFALVRACAASSCPVQLRKIWRNWSTSGVVNLRSCISFVILSSSARSCSVRSKRESWTKVQNLMLEDPSTPTSLMPASRAEARAWSNFFIRPACSSRVLGCQPYSFRISFSSFVSISPLLSLSYLSKSFWNSATSSSEKPAFLRSFSTCAIRQESTMLTKASNSMFPPLAAFKAKFFGGSWPNALRASAMSAFGMAAPCLCAL